jgi:NAD(P)-dependent dehydrogenase (short-subunit alcohol dehydrogenase family)
LFSSRLVLVGEEGALADTAEEVRRCCGDGRGVMVVGLDFEVCDEATVADAVDRAWRCFAGLDAVVNCYSYQGSTVVLTMIHMLPFLVLS